MSAAIRYQDRPTQVPAKDPDATLKYGIDWSDYLGSETIVASEWLAQEGIVVVSDTFDPTSTAVRLSGGTAGTRYKVTNRIRYTGAEGESIDDRTIIVPVREL